LILCSCHTISSADSYLSLRVPSSLNVFFNAISVGKIESGSSANVIPDTAIILGTARAYSEETRAALKDRVRELTYGFCGLFGCQGELEITSSCPTLVNDKEASDRLLKYAKELFGKKFCSPSASLSGRGGGSEDFSFISQSVPSAMVAMSAGGRKEGYEYPIHNSKAVFDEGVIVRGAAYLAYSALRYFEDN